MKFFFFSPNPLSPPPSSQQNESVYKTKPIRNKPYDYYLNHPSQQQSAYTGQRYERTIITFIYPYI